MLRGSCSNGRAPGARCWRRCRRTSRSWGARKRKSSHVAEAMGEGPIQAFLGHCARELGLWIIGGTIPIRVDGEPGARRRRVARVRRPRSLRRRGTTRSICSMSICRIGKSATASPRRLRRRTPVVVATPVGPGRPGGLLRRAFSRAVSDPAGAGCGNSEPAVSVYRTHGPGALGIAGARTRSRESVLRARACAERPHTTAGARPGAIPWSSIRGAMCSIGWRRRVPGLQSAKSTAHCNRICAAAFRRCRIAGSSVGCDRRD